MKAAFTSLAGAWRGLCRSLFLLCLLAQAGSALSAPTSDLRFRRLASLSSEDLAVLALMQDQQGFVWIGTYAGGLYRYNGYQAVRYTSSADPRSLPHDRVSAIYQDRRGRIWVGTQNGLAQFHPESNDFTRYAPASGPTNHRIIKFIVDDGHDGMWIATWGGLQHFDPQRALFRQYVHKEGDAASLANNDVNAVVLDRSGGLWLGTWPAGMDYLAPGAAGFVHYRIDSEGAPDPKLNIPRALLIDNDGVLWIGTEDGIVKWRIGSAWDQRSRIDSPSSRIHYFFIDREQAVWAGTQSNGLLRWDKGSTQPAHYLHRANDPYSLQADHVRAVMQDRGGMLWVATFTDGISLVNLNSRGFRRFIPHEPEAGQPNNALLTLAGAPNGRMWVAGNTGFSLFDPASGEVLKSWHGEPKRPGGLSSSSVYSLYQQPGGPLWVGTSAGLNRLDPAADKFKVIQFGSTASNYINAIAPGGGDVLWLGTANSVIRYHSASGASDAFLHKADDANSRSVDGTTCIVQDRKGRVWMGAEWNGGGLDMYDPGSGRFTHFVNAARADSLASDNVSTVYEDPRGRLWVGSARGVQEIVTGPDGGVHFHAVGPDDSVGRVKILAIEADSAGALWLSTAGALLRLDPASGAVSRFGADDGTTEGFTIGSSYAGPDGTLYFGGVKGMTGVRPEIVHTGSIAPQVAITDISVFNRSLKDGHAGPGVRLEGAVTAPQQLTLSVQESVFSLEFAALHFVDPAQNRYAYRLAGFDRDWVETDAAHRNATYTNLDPGSYQFEVKAANEHGVWSERITRTGITILPPFWQTWWFRVLSMSTSVLLLASAYSLRVRRLKRSAQHLEALVADRTRDLEQSNAKLAALSLTDGLTGITNRRGFDSALEKEWRRALRDRQPVALAMIDVDHFKKYNDHYGHQAGDECLRAVAGVIAAHARRPSDVAARYGGEEFALLLPHADAERALMLAQEMCRQMTALALAHAQSPLQHVSISIGVAVLVADETSTPEMLVRQADQALYRAKQEGRNRALM
jgi:diguanylate cyclase (GGDEF)-like protein